MSHDPVNSRQNFDQSVPWTIPDAIFVFLLFLLVPPLVTGLAVLTYSAVVPVDNEQMVQVEEAETESNADSLAKAHPLVQLIVQSKGSYRYPIIVALGFFIAVIIAPLVEEWFFRVVIQGAFVSWALSSRYRSGAKIFAITVPAVLFGAIHYRSGNETLSPELLWRSMIAVPVAMGIAFCLAFGTLWYRAKREGKTLRPADFGVEKIDLIPDAIYGVTAFLIMAPVLYLLNFSLQHYFPNWVSDPIPVGLFALGLGVVYYRTRRYSIVVAMHAALNLTGVIALLQFC